MKRYLVFADDIYYPGGGWEDFKDSFETELEAVAYSRGFVKDSYSWAHVVDSETSTIIFNAEAP